MQRLGRRREAAQLRDGDERAQIGQGRLQHGASFMHGMQ
jgi:hypothetical protein